MILSPQFAIGGSRFAQAAQCLCGTIEPGSYTTSPLALVMRAVFGGNYSQTGRCRVHCPRLHLPCRELEAGPLSDSIMNNKHAYSDSFLRKTLARNKVIVSVGFSLNAIRPSYFVARYSSRRAYTIIPINPGYEGELLCGQMVYARMDQTEQPMNMAQSFSKIGCGACHL